jgi:hypothetical protein
MWKKIFGASLAVALSTSASLAQTNPGLTQGQKLTPAQWNSLFASKQDTLGFTPMNAAGGVFGGRVVTSAPGASVSGFNLTPGSTPGSPSNGDLWMTSAGFYARVNGVTIGPITGGSTSSFGATTPVTVSFPSGVPTFACSTCGVTGSPLSQFASTTSAQFSGVLSDETGSGLAVFNNAPVLIAPVLGAATATSINKVAFTAPATGSTITIFDGKTLTVSNSLTFTGTDGNSFAFPSGGGTVATLASTQAFTNKTLSGSTNVLGGVTMTLGSDATGDLYYRNVGGILTRLPIGTASQVLTVSGGLPTWQAGSSAGSITAGTTTIGGTCSTGQNAYNNGGLFDCRNQSSSLTAGGGVTLSGTTNVTIAQRAPTVQVLSAGTGATYTTPSGVSHLWVRGCGGGGGGGRTAGGAGGTTSFSASTMSATGGNGGSGVAGTAASGGIGTNGQVNYRGNDGIPTFASPAGAGMFFPPMSGGASPLFGGANGGAAGETNSGAGGGITPFSGIGSNGATGAAGGCFERIVTSPSASYTYTIGAGGTAGTNGFVGGSGVIVVWEF